MDETKPPKNDLASLLRDFAQGASNSAATNLSMPVDAIAWLLRKGGMNIPNNPVGGSDWMAEKGFTPEPKNKLAGLLGDVAGFAAPLAAVSKAPQIAKGLLQMGEAMPMGSKGVPTLSKASPMADRGAIVWHGSPHKFDAFDASKIGTGEGAQAYGHGLYLAESPSVAKQYQAALSNPKYSSGGRELKGNEAWAAQFLHDFQGDALPKKVDANAAIAKAQEILKAGDTQSEILKHIKNLDSAGVSVENGALYKVDLPDEHIAKMLDWDKPLSQQSPHVQSALKDAKGMFLTDSNSPGNNVYGNMISNREITEANDSLTGQAADVARYLKSLDITGIKYLDGGSRGAGQGSSNYVVFPGNERLLKILERNGQKP